MKILARVKFRAEVDTQRDEFARLRINICWRAKVLTSVEFEFDRDGIVLGILPSHKVVLIGMVLTHVAEVSSIVNEFPEATLRSGGG